IEIEIAASVAVDAGTETRNITVGARKLLDILRALPDGSEVTLALTDKRLQVKSGKSRFNLQTLPSEEFPRLAGPEGESVQCDVPHKVRRDEGTLRQHARAPQDNRCDLNGRLMAMDAGEFRFIAKDRHRLAFASNTAADNQLGKQEVILPRKTVLELAKR